MSYSAEKIKGKWYLSIKEEILSQIEVNCPLCGDEMLKGQVSPSEPTPTLFCMCGLRIAIHQIIVETPGD